MAQNKKGIRRMMVIERTKIRMVMMKNLKMVIENQRKTIMMNQTIKINQTMQIFQMIIIKVQKENQRKNLRKQTLR